MQRIWAFIIIIAVIYALVMGNANSIPNIISKGATSTIENILTIAGLTCFWTGVFNILKHTPIIQKLSKGVMFITRPLFKKEEITEEILEDVALNVTSDALGVGNAATAYSIEAMTKMQKINQKNSPNDTMATFILLNTASIQILPTTIISLRTMFGSKNPTEIIIPVWIVSITSLIVGLLAIKVLNKVVKQ